MNIFDVKYKKIYTKRPQVIGLGSLFSQVKYNFGVRQSLQGWCNCEDRATSSDHKRFPNLSLMVDKIFIKDLWNRIDNPKINRAEPASNIPHIKFMIYTPKVFQTQINLHTKSNPTNIRNIHFKNGKSISKCISNILKINCFDL